MLVLFANRYQEGQVGGRGFLGLATLVFGNWRPAGVAAGAGLFGYFQGITLRTNPEQLVLALLLVGGARAGVAAARRSSAGKWAPLLDRRRRRRSPSSCLYVIADRPNNQFVYITPYLVTLIVVSVARPGAATAGAGRHPVAQGDADLTPRRRCAAAPRRRCCTTTSTVGCGRRR